MWATRFMRSSPVRATRQEEVRGLLSQAGWRELPVPQELRTHPQAARAWLEAERKRLEELNGAECKAMDTLRGQYRSGLEEARLRVALAVPWRKPRWPACADAAAWPACPAGFPGGAVEELKAALEARFHGRYWLDVKSPPREEAEQVPSLVRYPGWLMPFVPLVKSYGVPRYGEFDPTLPFAFTYLLLFGAMFGDIGHGAHDPAAVAGLVQETGQDGLDWRRCGAVSMLFGLLYGSIFGYEDVLEPVWLSPLHNPIHVLTVAVAFGVGFIVLTLLVNARNKWGRPCGRGPVRFHRPGGPAVLPGRGGLGL
jgi:V/A-type H+-transporting ATPase subunit I